MKEALSFSVILFHFMQITKKVAEKNHKILGKDMPW